jgi:type IV secretory pathway TrbL component
MLLSYALRIGVYPLFIVQLITGKENKEVTMIWLSIME